MRCSGGAHGDGTFFEISTRLSPFVNAVRNFGLVEQVRGISGQRFTGATPVSFNGISATCTVASDTSMAATIPVEASTGGVNVATPGGTLTSNQSFAVLK